jgi:thiamine-monophosphate kinase
LWVTGTVGNGVLGLWALQGKIADPDGSLAAHYQLPEPRLGLALTGIASAAMDMSDGLVQDCGHIARASGVALEIMLDRVPLSPSGRAAGPDFVSSGIAGGDDYELLLAVPERNVTDLLRVTEAATLPATRIGRFVAGAPEVRGIDANCHPVELGGGGWSHY